mmetsp:Transcript_43248/g.69138  ORF Transcript_43248/g.69138 Transcript_43248/m.69138 type:complete len:922 (-) Transcript_43248:148-2913(-)
MALNPSSSFGQNLLSSTRGSLQASTGIQGGSASATYAAILTDYRTIASPTVMSSPSVVRSVQGVQSQGSVLIDQQPLQARSAQSIQVQGSAVIGQAQALQPSQLLQPTQLGVSQFSNTLSAMTPTQVAATPEKGQHIAGSLVTKTTIEKVFIPADPSVPPVTLGSAGSKVESTPGIARTGAPQAQMPVLKAAVSDLPTMLPTVVAQPVSLAQPVRQFGATSLAASAIAQAVVQSGTRPADYVLENRSFIPPREINYVAIPQDVGRGGNLTYNPNTNVVESRNMYQIDDRGEMYQADVYQGDAAYDVYQGDPDMQQYRDHFYDEDQQYQDQQYNAQEQQYAGDGYYCDQIDEMQGHEQFAQDDPYAHMNYGTYDEGADVAAGMPRPQEEKREENPAEDQFTRLLNSLEARVDLMAQMQHTRAEIQKHTRNLQGNKVSSPTSRDSPHLALPGVDTRQQPYQVDLGPDRPFSSLMEDFSTTGRTTGRFGFDSHPVETTALVSTSGSDAARLARENAMLRDEFLDQRTLIESLTTEVTDMKHALQSIATDPGMLSRSAERRNDFYVPAGTRVEARWMQDGNTAGYCGPWMPGYIAQENQDGSFQVEYDNGDACTCVPRDCVQIWAEVDGEYMLIPAHEGDNDNSATSEEVRSLQNQLEEERKRHESSTQQWTMERQRLLEELQTLKGGEIAQSMMMITEPLIPMQFGGRRGGVAPLCRNPCGLNIELSEDGYVAKRVRGCRQSVVVGSAPLEPQDLGCYFEVVVRETVNGWVGGLGLGVTRVSPAEMKRMPDKAWRIPSTFIVGYWGCLFLDGREKRTRWKADTLKVGSRVGLLVTGDGRGDLIVFVDGEPVVRADDVLPNSFSSGGMQEPLYPVIDVFAATLSVELMTNATAPAKPWGRDPSPPGSPASVVRSIQSSAVTLGAM